MKRRRGTRNTAVKPDNHGPMQMRVNTLVHVDIIIDILLDSFDKTSFKVLTKQISTKQVLTKQYIYTKCEYVPPLLRIHRQ